MQKIRKENITYLIAALILTFALVCMSVCSYFGSCRKIRDGVVRLHVLAASDSEEDQTVKLAVRDEILKSSAELFGDLHSAMEAKEGLSASVDALVECANGVLTERGCAYKARAEVVYEYFDTREYDGITLPAGSYTALRVVLGDGEGKNWWCVMFPPLCLPAVTGNSEVNDDIFASEEGISVVSGKTEYKVRFRIVEIAEKIISYFQ